MDRLHPNTVSDWLIPTATTVSGMLDRRAHFSFVNYLPDVEKRSLITSTLLAQSANATM